MPVNYSELFQSRCIEVERIALAQIIRSEFLPPELYSEMFDGSEKKLFDGLKEQWQKHGSIDSKLLKEKHFTTISECLDYPGSYSEHVVEILTDYAISRNFARAILEFDKSDCISESISGLQSRISQILFKTKKDYNHHDSIMKMIDGIERNHKAQRSTAGYSTGIRELDRITSGIEKGKVYAIGALKKTGKSRFGVFLSCRMKAAGAGVLWNSLEMSDVQLNMLATAYYSGLNSNVFGKYMKTNEYDMFQAALTRVNDLDWSIYKEHAVYDLRSRILAERQKKSVDVVIVDFIQRMRCDKYKADRVREVEAIAQDLADMSRDLDIAVIEFTQLSGAAEKLEDDEVPNMSHFKESQAIPENADVNIVLHNSDRHNNPFNDDKEYQIPRFKMRVEQRYDVSGSVFDLNADLRTCKFYDK